MILFFARISFPRSAKATTKVGGRRVVLVGLEVLGRLSCASGWALLLEEKEIMPMRGRKKKEKGMGEHGRPLGDLGGGNYNYGGPHEPRYIALSRNDGAGLLQPPGGSR